MRLRTAFVFLLIVTGLFTGCGKNEKIEGKVQDVFGNPLKDVVVKIQKSTFSSITDGSGDYSIDYAPGTINMVFSKNGYTTSGLDLNIQQKTHFPAEIITLYPIPQEDGMFYIDTDNKRLVKLEENGRLAETETQTQSFFFTNYRYYVRYLKPSTTSIRSGKAMFIDRIPYQTELATVKENGLIYEGTLSRYERYDKYSGFIKDSSSKIGAEKLLIRTAELTPGAYAWVKMRETYRTGAIPEKAGAAFGFQVEGSPTK